MKLALSMEGELEDRMEAPDWYSSLTGEAKTEADSLLAQMGKVSVLVYGRYSQYDERMENFVNEYLKQKKPGIRAGGISAIRRCGAGICPVPSVRRSKRIPETSPSLLVPPRYRRGSARCSGFPSGSKTIRKPNRTAACIMTRR